MEFTAAQVIRILNLDITQNTLKNAEESSRIPKSIRRIKGKNEYRYWVSADLPSIANEFGSQVKKPRKCITVAVYMSKGGVGKTTTSFNFSRFLALNGLRVLTIGTDFQRSLSRYFGLDVDETPYSLFDLIGSQNVKNISEIIQETEISTHDYIPESRELDYLDMFIFANQNRERILARHLSKIKNDYDVIVIDCPPYWSQMVSNALVAADAIIAPITAESDSVYAFGGCLYKLQSFKETAETSWNTIKFFINNIDRRNNVEKIHRDEVLEEYPEYFTKSVPIRRSVTVKEAASLEVSVIEYALKSDVVDDMHTTYNELWRDCVNDMEQSCLSNVEIETEASI